MGRSRYVITEPDKPHFLTCTVVEWMPVFTRPDAVHILLDSWLHQRAHDGLQLHGYVVMLIWLSIGVTPVRVIIWGEVV